jgi:multiple RNA-binding domain-containing protein 1
VVQVEEKEPELETSFATVYIKNLNFKTTEEDLQRVFRNLPGFRSVTIPRKIHPTKKTKLSMGFGFAEFQSQDEAKRAITVLQGTLIDQHSIKVSLSHRGALQGDQSMKQDVVAQGTKLLIRNVPFEATRQELKDLFGYAFYGLLGDLMSDCV